MIVLLPLLGSIFAGFLGRYVGRKGSVFITLFCMFLVTISAVYKFFAIALNNSIEFITFTPWINLNTLCINWGFLFDSISLSMLAMISIVSTIVHIYASSYMSEDPHLSRFMSYLSLFTFFMFILVSADNLIQMFLGWEGVGVCSYLLINFWFTRIQANKASLKALIVNRIGDFGLLIGILLIIYFFRTLDFSIIFSLVPYFVGTTFTFLNYELEILSLISFFLFIGSIGKSAQLGLHTWLGDAMEGPTPVSALIHAATMVTAGVFLIIRCSPLFEYSPNILIFITIVGCLTAFFASTVGVVQNDIKRVIAYSTASQLGYMIFACGISGYNVSFFHLINHAFFKALLFLASGIIIHALGNEQDMRKMGGLIKLLPYSYTMMLIGSLALGGFPFLAGFYSKDLILELAYTKYTTHSIFAYVLGSLAAFFTSFYSGRLLFLTFFNKTNSFKTNIFVIHEGNEALGLSLIILVLGSIFSGYFLKDMFVGFGSIFFDNAILILHKNAVNFDLEFIPLILKLLPTIFSLTGMILSFLIYVLSKNVINKILHNLILRKIYIFLNTKWFFDHIYNHYINSYLSKIGYDLCYKIIDKGFLEYFGPSGLINLSYKISKQTLKFQTGLIYHYICLMFLGWLMFFIYIEFNYL